MTDTAVPEALQRRLDHILFLHDVRRYGDAEAALRASLAEHPGWYWPHLQLAHTLLKVDRAAEADASGPAAVGLAPENLECIRAAAETAYLVGDRTAAVELARRAVRLDPANANAHCALARAHINDAKAPSPEALSAIDEAIRLEPGSASLHNQRGFILVLLERVPEGRSAYEQALRLDPENWWALNNLARALLKPHPVRAARLLTSAAERGAQHEFVRDNLTWAVDMWIYRLLWILLWGGVALTALTPLPAPVRAAALVVLLLACVLGTARLIGALPRGSALTLLTMSTPRRPRLVARAGAAAALDCVTVVAAPWSLVASGLLVALLVVERKVDFSTISWSRARADSQ
jgi:Tfp pilus assembly protein PilF